MGQIDHNFGQADGNKNDIVREYTQEEFDALTRKHPVRNALVIAAAMAAGAGGMYLWADHKIAETATATRTQALLDNQPRIFAAGKAAGLKQGEAAGVARGRKDGFAQGAAQGTEQGKAEGREQGLQQGRAEGYTKGVDAAVAKLKPVMNEMVARERRQTQELRTRAKRIIVRQQAMLKAQRPCYSGYNVDVNFLFGTGVKIGGRNPASCRL